MESVLISFLYLMLHIAIIIFVAFVIVWVLKLMSFTPDADVLKWGKIVVLLLIVIAVVVWAASLIGYGPGLYGPTPRIMR